MHCLAVIQALRPGMLNPTSLPQSNGCCKPGVSRCGVSRRAAGGVAGCGARRSQSLCPPVSRGHGRAGTREPPGHTHARPQQCGE